MGPKIKKKEVPKNQPEIKTYFSPSGKSPGSPKKRPREEEAKATKEKDGGNEKRAKKDVPGAQPNAPTTNNNNNNNNNNNEKKKSSSPKEKEKHTSSKSEKSKLDKKKATGKDKAKSQTFNGIEEGEAEPQIIIPEGNMEIIGAHKHVLKKERGMKAEAAGEAVVIEEVEGLKDVRSEPGTIMPHPIEEPDIIVPHSVEELDQFGEDEDDDEVAGDLQIVHDDTTEAESQGTEDDPCEVKDLRVITPAPTPPPKQQKSSFKCKVCDQWFPNRYFQKKHMLMEHENQLYECRVCSFNSVNPEKLKSHIIKQHVIKKERTESCSLGELKMDLDELMTKHTPRKVMMEDGVALGRDANNKIRYICAMCDRIYSSKYALERHVRCHTGEKPYVCDVCNFSTSYREHMQRHMTSVHLIVHSDEPKMKYVPKNRRKMIMLMEKNISTEDDKQDIEKMEMEGQVADEEQEDNEGEEVQEVEGEPEVGSSPVSVSTTDSSSSAAKKKRRNILRKRFECAACGMKATHKTDLVNHIKDKHPNAHIESLDNGDGSKVHLIVTVSKKQSVSRRMSITCPDCSKVFHDTWKYKVHMRSHTGVKPFGCSVCSFFATSKMTIRDHIHRKHKDVANPKILLRTVCIDGTIDHVELTMPHREFKCENCDEVFNDNYHLKLHKKKNHTEAAPFSCSQCGHREWARANIIIHCIQDHNPEDLDGLILRNEKPFTVGPQKLPKCMQCNKVFPYQSQLYIHQKQHTGERSFSCDVCSYRTNIKAALEKHMLKHLTPDSEEGKSTPGHNFSCTMCNYRTKQRASLEKHMLKHVTSEPEEKPANDKSFSCDMCSFTSKRKGTLEKHILRHLTSDASPKKVAQKAKKSKKTEEEDPINFVDVSSVEKRDSANRKASKATTPEKSEKPIKSSPMKEQE